MLTLPNCSQAPPKTSQLLLPGFVALGLRAHGVTKPLCWLTKAPWDYINAGNEKPVVVKQEG